MSPTSSVLKYRLIIDTAKPQLRCLKKEGFSNILGAKPKHPLIVGMGATIGFKSHW